MYKIKYVLLLIFISLANVATAKTLPKDVIHALDQQLVENSHRYGVVSQSVLILKDSKVIYTGLQGSANLELSTPIQGNNIYPVYSIAKLFASVLMMQLVEQDKVDPNKSIREYLPHLPKRWEHVTVKHCLNHMSGLPEYFSMEVIRQGFLESKDAVFESLSDKPFQFEVGSANRYNNTNYLIIAAIIEQKYNKPYHEVVDEVIIDPLALKHTGFASARTVIAGMVTSYRGDDGSRLIDRGVDWPAYTFVHSALYSSTNDLATFMTAVAQGKFTSLKTLSEMWRPISRNDGSASSYAFGWEYAAIDGFYQVGHDGGNRAKLRYYFKSMPGKDNYTLVYLTNGNNRDVWTDVLAGSLMSIIDPDQFRLDAAGEYLFDKVLGGASDAELDHVFTVLAKNDAVIAHGLERFINIKAYAIQYAAGVDSALALFELNTRQFPQSANVWDSLAEAWLAKGDKIQAIKFYQKALSVNPSWSNAKHQLDALIE